MQQEEQLADSLIDQALHEIEHHDWTSSVCHLQQAASIESQMTKIGAQVYAALAYSYAEQGNFTQARSFLTRHEDEYGDFPLEKPFQELLNKAAQMLAYAPPSQDQAMEFTQPSCECFNVCDQKKLACQEACLKDARASLERFDYARCLQICLGLLRDDFDQPEVHMLLTETYNQLGSSNPYVCEARQQFKEIMLNQHHM
jgi:hypothetical protein